MSTDNQLAQVAAAFSQKAGVYDAFGQDHANLQRMREKVYAQVARWTPAGSHILELNAGTGLDAVALVERGYRVHATDIAPGMVAEMSRKKEVLGLDGRFTYQHCSFTELDQVAGGPFDVVFSNFGGLNCVADLTAVTRHLPRLMKPGGTLIWVIMPPVCPWELALLPKDWRVATRRLRRGGVVANVEGVQFQTFYFTPGQVQKTLGPAFTTIELSGLSVVTPTADNDRFARRHPRLFRWLVRLDDWLSKRPLFNRIGDFFILTARFDPLPNNPPNRRRGLEIASSSRVEDQGGGSFAFACPVCRGQLERLTAEMARCPVDDLTFGCEDGIWRFLPPARAAALAQFQREYETVRRREGRGSDDPAFYRALPFVAGKNQQISQLDRISSLRASRPSRFDAGWAERARRFAALVEQVIQPLENKRKRPLKILDLGAGSGWLSNRLAERGHLLAAVDLGVNDWDGLDAGRHYKTEFTRIQAEFDHLPLDDNQADLVIFNASFHYSVDYEVTLQEALRVLWFEGVVAVVDTAVYQNPASGQQMVAEREAAFLKQYGFASNVLPSENFLTYGRINELGSNNNLTWQLFWPVAAWRRWVRRVKVTVRRQREPAQFPIIVFTADSAESLERRETRETRIKDFTDSKDLSPLTATSALPAVRFFRIGQNAGWLFGARVGQQAILLLFVALVARQLGDVGLGQVAWVTAVLYLGNVFSTWGLDTVLLRQIGAERRTNTVPLAAALVLELGLAAGFIFLLFILPFDGQSAETVTGLRLYSGSLLPLAWLTLTSAALRGHEQMGWLAGLMLGTAVLQVVGTAVLFLSGGGFIQLMGWLLAVQIVGAGAGWLLCHRVLPDFGLNWQFLRRETMRELARTGFWLALLVGTAVLLQRLGILLLGWLGNAAQTGQLAAALRLVEAARLLPGAVMGAIFPVLAKRNITGGRWQVAGVSIGNYRWGLLVYGLLAAGALWLLARPLVSLLFGDGYDAAVSLLQILAWGVIPFTISLPLSVELVIAGKEKRVLLATFVVLVGTAVITTVGFLQNSLVGMAVGLVLGEWLLAAALFAAANDGFYDG